MVQSTFDFSFELCGQMTWLKLNWLVVAIILDKCLNEHTFLLFYVFNWHVFYHLFEKMVLNMLRI